MRSTSPRSHGHKGAPALLMKSCMLAGLLSIYAFQPASAQALEPEPIIESGSDRQVDPPSRVARLSHLDGTVSLAPAGTDEWAETVLNRPLTTGDRLWVGGRAELQMGSSTVHMDQRTGVSFAELNDDSLVMNLTEGSIVVHVRRKLADERIEIDTPNTVVSLLQPGEYQIQVNEAGDEAVVRVRSGAIEVAGERQTYSLRAGEQGVFKGTADLAADIGPLDSRTAFERWANERERSIERAASSRYVSSDVIGYEDLDRYGEWVREPEHGHVWRPIHVHGGWAPYRDGRWVWVAPWGWTWVDAAPWGFAPFHYGRWAYLRSRWCWVPGPIHARPVYAPALVAWVGGPRVSVSVSYGPAIGWYPLGPREIYVPGHRHSRRYIHHVNVTNTVIINNTYIDRIYEGRRHGDYRYRREPRAITAVRRESFVGGEPVRSRLVEVNERALHEWRDDPRPPAIAPDRASVLAGRRIASRSLARTVERDRELTMRRGGSRVFDAEQPEAGSHRGASDVFSRTHERTDRPLVRPGQLSRNDSNIVRTRPDVDPRHRVEEPDRPLRSPGVRQGRERPESRQPGSDPTRPPHARVLGSVGRIEVSPERGRRIERDHRARPSEVNAPVAPPRSENREVRRQQRDFGGGDRDEGRSSRAYAPPSAPSDSIIQRRSTPPSVHRFERAPQQPQERRIPEAPRRESSLHSRPDPMSRPALSGGRSHSAPRSVEGSAGGREGHRQGR